MRTSYLTLSSVIVVITWTSLAGMLVGGARELPLTATQSTSLARQTATRIPIGYDPQPNLPALVVRDPHIGGDGFGVAIVNRASVALTTLSYVAIVETVDERVPVRVLTSDRWPLALAPGAKAGLESGWLADATLETLARETGRPIQIFLTPGYAKYADGTEWRVKIDATAVNHRQALKQWP